MIKSHKQRRPAEETQVATPPAGASWAELRQAAMGCTACHLHRCGTQTVFGEGAPDAEIILVGEQPGDQEDRQGQPFVGPAGQLLNRALEAAGVDRSRAYVTNVVKHFKWEARGKRRLHKKPDEREIAACRPWLEAELELLHPRVLVCLGTTALRFAFGPGHTIEQLRGKLRSSPFCTQTLVTVHPSALLRMPDPDTRAAAFRRFVEDLKCVVARPQGPQR